MLLLICHFYYGFAIFVGEDLSGNSGEKNEFMLE